MKANILSITSILTLTAALAHAQPEAVDAFAQNKKLGRGVNIIGYDPIWRSKEEARFQEKYFRLLKEAGFNSVRINLHPFRQMNATNNWRCAIPGWRCSTGP
jgi:endoglucanase